MFEITARNLSSTCPPEMPPERGGGVGKKTKKPVFDRDQLDPYRSDGALDALMTSFETVKSRYHPDLLQTAIRCARATVAAKPVPTASCRLGRQVLAHAGISLSGRPPVLDRVRKEIEIMVKKREKGKPVKQPKIDAVMLPTGQVMMVSTKKDDIERVLAHFLMNQGPVEVNLVWVPEINPQKFMGLDEGQRAERLDKFFEETRTKGWISWLHENDGSLDLDHLRIDLVKPSPFERVHREESLAIQEKVKANFKKLEEKAAQPTLSDYLGADQLAGLEAGQQIRLPLVYARAGQSRLSFGRVADIMSKTVRGGEIPRIPAVITPNGELIMVDRNHHTAMLIALGHEHAEFEIVANCHGMERNKFLKRAEDELWIYMAEPGGKKIPADQIEFLPHHELKNATLRHWVNQLFGRAYVNELTQEIVIRRYNPKLHPIMKIDGITRRFVEFILTDLFYGILTNEPASLDYLRENTPHGKKKKDGIKIVKDLLGRSQKLIDDEFLKIAFTHKMSEDEVKDAIARLVHAQT